MHANFTGVYMTGEKFEEWFEMVNKECKGRFGKDWQTRCSQSRFSAACDLQGSQISTEPRSSRSEGKINIIVAGPSGRRVTSESKKNPKGL